MQKLRILLVSAALVYIGGCGLIARLGSPTENEKYVPAEFNLANQEGAKILVLVNQPGWLNTDINMRFRLTDVIMNRLVREAGIEEEAFIDYDKLYEFRSSRSDFSQLSAVEVGRALGAEFVLLAEVTGYELTKNVEVNYYQGFMTSESVLFDALRGAKLWPMTEKSRSVKVGFEVERGGKDIAQARLVTDMAHGITRYLYNCPRKKFKFADDRDIAGWGQWE